MTTAVDTIYIVLVNLPSHPIGSHSTHKKSIKVIAKAELWKLFVGLPRWLINQCRTAVSQMTWPSAINDQS